MPLVGEKQTLEDWKRIVKEMERKLGVNHPDVRPLRKWIIIQTLKQIPGSGATVKEKIIARLKIDSVKLKYPGPKKVVLKLLPVKPKGPPKPHLK